MKKLMFLIAGSGVLLFAGNGLSQSSLPPDPNDRPPEYVTRRQENRRYWDRINGKNDMGMIADRNPVPRRSVPRRQSDGAPYSKKELEQPAALKRPSEADAAKYADSLKQSKTGMFRLFPYLPRMKDMLVRVDGECENFVPGGSTYSFRAEKHGYSDWFDIRFDGANFIADAFLSQGIIVPLGDVPPESVTLETSGMKFLTGFAPEVENREIRKQFAQIAAVVRAGDFYYSKKVKAVENTTYATRVIAYSRQNKLYARAPESLRRSRTIFTRQRRQENRPDRRFSDRRQKRKYEHFDSLEAA